MIIAFKNDTILRFFLPYFLKKKKKRTLPLWKFRKFQLRDKNKIILFEKKKVFCNWWKVLLNHFRVQTRKTTKVLLTILQVFLLLKLTRCKKDETNLFWRIEPREAFDTSWSNLQVAQQKKKKYQDFTIFLKTHFHRAGFPSILYKTRQPSYPRRFNTGLSSRTNRHNPDIL